MSNGVFALIGVVVGAFLGTVLELAIGAWRDRRALRAATRLLDIDFFQLRAWASASVKREEVAFDRSDVDRLLTTWAAHGELLARKRRPDEWAMVARPLLLLPIIVETRRTMSEYVKGSMERLVSDIDGASAVLKNYTGISPAAVSEGSVPDPAQARARGEKQG